ncbi:MAG: aldo/keto reductase [Planctomycetota bacterium]|nr:aldo/keto reductase [Planctomycetota bacterium]
MLYRRFGKTGLRMPVLSCGGMRYQQSWKSEDAIGEESQRNVEACIRRALEVGITHIETARGYGTSEEQLGRVLPELPRGELIVQTKVAPSADVKKFLQTFETCMQKLRLEHVDLLSLHGINNEELLEWSLRPGGCLEAALKLKAQGRARHVGFSTHAHLPVILDAIRDGRFEYVNLHWYYVSPFNWPAIEEAARREMGVFIISPSDKGGKLYQPSAKLVELTKPYSPMVFNDAWCLARPEVHTLSLGAARPTDFDEHLKALDLLKDGVNTRALLKPVEERLEAELVKVHGREWISRWHEGLPHWRDVPGEIHVFEILRLRNFAKAFDMLEYGKMRYNLLGNGGHWFPGRKADKLDEVDVRPALKASPFAKLIPDYLRETHELLSGEEVKRLGRH